MPVSVSVHQHTSNLLLNDLHCGSPIQIGGSDSQVLEGQWRFQSFSAPCNSHQDLFCHYLTVEKDIHTKSDPHSICFVRSKSESGALNKLALSSARPCTLLEEFQLWQNRRPNSALNTRQLQSDSEGEESQVSSPEEEHSPLASCFEEAQNGLIFGVLDGLEKQFNEEDQNEQFPNNFQMPSIEVAELEANEMMTPILPQMGRLKKNVRFADDCGQCLETVRVMTEPSDYPPKISPAVLRRFRRAAAATMALHSGVKMLEEEDSDEPDEDEQAKRRKSSAWKMTFKQPASEYIRFRDTLDKQKVALENVMLKNELGRMIGTIKVANISFEKRVFIRFTSDAWNSFKDQPAQYQSSPSKTFDTFRFDIELPRNEGSTRRIEFCVCFVAGPNGLERWDSNGGKNFALTSPDEPPSSFCSQPFSPTDLNHNNAPFGTQKSQPRPIEREDAYRMDWNSPTGCLSTQFGAWKQLPTDGPYW